MLTRTRVARIFTICRTPKLALRAAQRLRALGHLELAEALTAHAGALRAVGYPHVAELYRRQRNEALGMVPEEQQP